MGKIQTFFVYLVYNKVSKKIYVGWCSSEFFTRWESHIEFAMKGAPWYLSCAIRKYGPENFGYAILNVISTKKEALELEKFWIRTLGSHTSDIGYNMTMGGEGGAILPEIMALRKLEGRYKSITKGTVWITNGIIFKRVPEKDVPNGWFRKHPSNGKTIEEICGLEKSIKLSLINPFRRENRNGRSSPRKGARCSEESKKKNRESHLGKIPWNKGKRLPRPRGLNFWITNGVSSKKLLIGSDIPNGWKKGHTISGKKLTSCLNLIRKVA